MLIGLTGKKGVGKDTVCALLSHYFPKMERMAFADKLKVSALASLGITGSRSAVMEIADELKENGTIIINGIDMLGQSISITGREYLQWYGTEAHRDMFGADFWINVSDITDKVYEKNGFVCLTDIRFKEEANAVQALNGYIALVTRPNVNGEDKHSSEQGIPSAYIDYIIDNSGDLEHLKKGVKEFAEFISLQEMSASA